MDAAEEPKVLAEVDLAVGAHLAGPAGQGGLHDDPVPDRHAMSVAAELADHADDLVAGVVGKRHERVVPGSGVGVGSADPDYAALDQDLPGTWSGAFGLADDDLAWVDGDPPHSGWAGGIGGWFGAGGGIHRSCLSVDGAVRW